MNKLKLPLVQLLVDSSKGKDLSKVKIIGAQHILETTHAMFRSLYCIGLKPENISLIGKCYSTCREVYKEMLADGIDVSNGSFAYSSHLSFDEQYCHEVQNFLASHLADLTSGKYERIIVLDDGGKCINYFNQQSTIDIPIVAIEQTSAGYNAIKNQALLFPVINVARSPAKLELESPMIAEAAAKSLFQSLHKRQLFPTKALIIGGGPIGKAMKNHLSSEIEVAIYDENPDLSDLNDNLATIIPNYPMIIGCTGKTSVPKKLHKKISRGTILVSVSSADREFDAVYLRKFLPESSHCHQDLLIDGKLLIKGGFPVNFDGERENIAPERIQLTIALITAGILQANNLSIKRKPSILAVTRRLESSIVNRYNNYKNLECLVACAK